ncbi:class I SAM-dependent methyltransferase [Stenotrophomonas acidaminiphila]|uniref:class I SAM-dependent methyltransferase n=1 Tax=Stenotrophomonas acidaminiphila TaxID=128780 RepID=UPI00137555F3|nr:class I SAM-dependent methyltransferase [Stenotrophomonas acidaminiphila]NCT86235.1 class I SAM-dependent methyltransferase [Stenotrophomonas acidaminiphila]
MNNASPPLRRLAGLFRRTPLHPQWLLGRRTPPVGIHAVRGRVLDIGAADRWIEPLLDDSVHYIALDFPCTGADMYGARPCVFADAAHLPLGDNSVQAVFCLEVLEHVPRPAVVMAEISRVLAPGGKAWVSMPFLYPVHDAPFDVQRYTPFGLQRDVQAAGLEVVCLHRSSHSLRNAGLLGCLAIAGGVNALSGWKKWPLLPPALLAIFTLNLAAAIGSLVWPDWDNMSHGHELELRKP